MPKVRLLAPAIDNSGNPHAADEVVDVSDELAQEWRLSGKASLLEDEERQAQAAQGGNYTAVTGRDDAAALGGGGSGKLPGPQAEDDEDEPKRKARK